MADNLEDKEGMQADLGATGQSAFDEEVDHQISRMMGEGGVAPPVRPRRWKTWKQDKAELNSDEENVRLE